MLPDKVKEFHKVRAEYFKKKEDIAKAMFELDCLLKEANDALSDTVDNGFTNEELAEVSAEYADHKFDSPVVQAFLEKVDNLLFKDVCPEMKRSLEVTSLRIDTTYDSLLYSDGKLLPKAHGPVIIEMIDTSTQKSFSVCIPVKGSVSTDMVNWNYNGEGLYIVSAYSSDEHRHKEICRVFDFSKISGAIEKLLRGEFDNELDADADVLTSCLIMDKIHDTTSHISRYCFDSWSYILPEDARMKYVEVHDLFGDNKPPSVDANDRVSNCVDDSHDLCDSKNRTM